MRDARNSFKQVERILRRDSGLITANPRPIRYSPPWNVETIFHCVSNPSRFAFLFNIVMFQIICSNRIKSFPCRQITFNSRLDCYRWNQYWLNRKISIVPRGIPTKNTSKGISDSRCTRTYVHIYIQVWEIDEERKISRVVFEYRVTQIIKVLPSLILRVRLRNSILFARIAFHLHQWRKGRGRKKEERILPKER